jgi:hypothetical protein
MKFVITGPSVELCNGKPRLIKVGRWIDRNKYTVAVLRELAKQRKDDREGKGKWRRYWRQMKRSGRSLGAER